MEAASLNDEKNWCCYAEVCFPFAIVGFEMFAELCAADFASGLPAVRRDGLLLESP